MRYSIPLVLAAFGIAACEAPTALEDGRLAPADAAVRAGGGPIAHLAGSAEIPAGKAGSARITVNARAIAGGLATGTFRIRTDAGTLTGRIDCLEVRDGRATASGPLDPDPRRKAGDVVIHVVDASVRKIDTDAAGYGTAARKGKIGCAIAKFIVRDTQRGNFVIRGETDDRGKELPKQPGG